MANPMIDVMGPVPSTYHQPQDPDDIARDNYLKADMWKYENNFLRNTAVSIMISVNNAMTKRILPWEACDGVNYSWTKMSVEPVLMAKEPEFGVPRGFRMEREVLHAQLDRSGIYFIVGHDAHKTGAGPDEYYAKLATVVQSALETCNVEGVLAMLEEREETRRCDRILKEHSHTVESLYAGERAMWGAVQKSPFGLDRVIAEGKKTMLNINNKHADAILVPYGVAMATTMGHWSNMSAEHVGTSRAVQTRLEGPDSVRVTRDVEIVEIKPVTLGLRGSTTTADLLRTSRMIGDFFVVPFYAAGVTSDNRMYPLAGKGTTAVFDANLDSFTDLSWNAVYRKSELGQVRTFHGFDRNGHGRPDQLTPARAQLVALSQWANAFTAADSGTMIVDHIQGFTLAQLNEHIFSTMELAQGTALGDADNRPDADTQILTLGSKLSPFLQRACAHAVTLAVQEHGDNLPEGQAPTPDGSDELVLFDHPLVAQAFANVVASATTESEREQLHFADGDVHRREALTEEEAGHDLKDMFLGSREALQELHATLRATGVNLSASFPGAAGETENLDAHGTHHLVVKGGFDFLCMRPFRCYSTGTGILCRKGPELGATLRGGDDVQFANNVISKSFVYHFTFWHTAVVKEPKCLLHMDAIYMCGYESGDTTEILSYRRMEEFQNRGHLRQMRADKASVIALPVPATALNVYTRALQLNTAISLDGTLDQVHRDMKPELADGAHVGDYDADGRAMTHVQTLIQDWHHWKVRTEGDYATSLGGDDRLAALDHDLNRNPSPVYRTARMMDGRAISNLWSEIWNFGALNETENDDPSVYGTGINKMCFWTAQKHPNPVTGKMELYNSNTDHFGPDGVYDGCMRIRRGQLLDRPDSNGPR